MTIIPRTAAPYLRKFSGQYPVVTITGPRQSGKTTLCRMVFADKKYVSLENLDTRRFAQEDPRGFLAGLPDGAILDEIQQAPELLSYIQTIVDEEQRPGLFILTGSQQFEVTSAVNQSLAGRTAIIKLLPLSMDELDDRLTDTGVDQLLLKGFYPRIWKDDLDPVQALAAYLETYVERDIRKLINIKDLVLLQRFVTLCAGRIGQLLNFSNLAADAGVSHQTARNWLTLLEASFILFRLPPYAANIAKRLVKSPKLYFYDVGLAAHLLGLESVNHVSRDPLRGNLFENLVIMEALKFRLHRGKRSNLHFYRDSNGNEVDLLLSLGPDLYPVEIKAGMTINRDYFKGLDHFGKNFPHGQGRALVYGGDEEQQRSTTSVSPAISFHRLLARLT
ncbi:ATP-binding protein [Desulfurivibrio sp. D14AmB]|uniref:ATP-binding protein n=1 Tax=Desulfurivibrio sp. D14AmB TaxID=3374370 RepID=UPI00376EDEA6